MELRDKNGLTEAGFLASYSPKNYERPSLTADIAVFSHEKDRLRLLLIKRGGHPYLGRWALPGGFANKNETIEATAARELHEETGLQGLSFAPVGLFTSPGRDPRMWVVSQAFVALIPPERRGEIQAGDDAAGVKWFDVSVDKAGENRERRNADEVGTEKESIEGENAEGDNVDGENIVIRFSAENSTLSVKLRLSLEGTVPALQTLAIKVLENSGLAFDHGEIIAQALYKLGYIKF